MNWIRDIFKKIVLFLINSFLLSFPFGFRERPCRLFLSFLGVCIDRDVQLSEGLYLYDGRNLKIDKGVRLGGFCKIWDFSSVSFGEFSLVSHNLTIVAGTHDTVDYSNKPGPVIIGKNVWIGVNVTIVGPVCIGDDVIIGAGAVVLNDIPSRTVCAGVPCRVIRSR